MIKRTIPIVFAFDENLIFPASVSLTSLLENASPYTVYDIFILYPGGVNFDTTDLDRLAVLYGNCKITYREVNQSFDGAYEIRGITTPAYYRL